MVTDGLTWYDMIIGRDLINELGIDIKGSDMSIYWKGRSTLLAPLTALTAKGKNFIWEDVHTKCFNAIKQVIGREVLLAYPDFNKPFKIHTDASKTQLGAVISQDNKPIAFFSRKLNGAQLNYTTTEKELLSIVEILKEFQNIFLRHQITVHTNHKNLTYKNVNALDQHQAT
jgi:hypothetical protein